MSASGTPLEQAVIAGRIEVSGLAHRYPDGTVALDGVDLIVEAGETVALVGPNGAGKSTLLLHLDGILQPTAGSVRIGGTDVVRESLPLIRARVGFVFQDPDDQLFSPTVADDVAYGPRHAGLDLDQVAERVAAALATVGVADLAERAPHHLSVGQRKRVALATVLSMDPEVLVFDEPTAGLDARARRDVVSLIADRAETVVVSTHDLALADAVATRIVLLDAGRVVMDAPAADVLGDEALLEAHGLEPICR